MEDNMVEKYQQHYNQVLSGTLSDVLMKSISYQANIKLANEIISEQEKTITELKSNTDKSKKDLEEALLKLKNELEIQKNNKVVSENLKISNLESTVRAQSESIAKLNNELVMANKIKNEFDTVKNQASSADIFRKELIKERDSHEQTRNDYEIKLKELTEQLELLKAPPKRKKTIRKTDVLDIIGLSNDNEVSEIVEEPLQETVKDGGTF